MSWRDKGRIAKIAVVATLLVWGLLTGISTGSQYQDATDWPFSEVATAVVAMMVVLSILLTIAPLTRDFGKMVGVWAVAFILAVLIGHLLGNQGPGGPEVPRSLGKKGVQ